MEQELRHQVPAFGRKFLDGQETFSRIGNGELGGKATGLARIQYDILSRFDTSEFPGVEVVVPNLVVLTTDLFQSFMDHNKLWEVGLSDQSDLRIGQTFQRGDVPPAYVGDLRALLQRVHQPLAIRSSSLLEDALQHPLAGVYATKMIPNQNPLLDRRHSLLLEAVKLVWASTFFGNAKGYLRSIGKSPLDERMAVVVQEVLGRRFGDRFYPALSGVARSYNYYPSGNARPEEGVANLALGLGKTIVDGGLCWSYSPAFPASPPPFNDVNSLLKNTQTRFWAVHMGTPPTPDPVRETEYLIECDLETAAGDGALKHLVSTYDPSSDRTYPGMSQGGPHILDFSPLLRLRQVPVNEVLRRLLQASEEVLGGPVELEFALDLDPTKGLPARLGFLQVRPMRVSHEVVEIGAEELAAPSTLLASTSVMGNGSRLDIRDVVYIKPRAFEARATRQMAREVAEINRVLVAADRPYLLLGFGRWGSSDPWLGVPVEWSDISGARVIVEATLPEMNPDLSQGSHFFHNLIGFKVLYLSVPHLGGRPIDWAWLDGHSAEAESDHVRHVRTSTPLTVKVDGRGRRGVIRRGEGNDG